MFFQNVKKIKSRAHNIQKLWLKYENQIVHSINTYIIYFVSLHWRSRCDKWSKRLIFFFTHAECESRVMQKQNSILSNIKTTSTEITNRSNMHSSITIRVLMTTERLITQSFRIRQQNDIITTVRFLFLTSFDVANDILTALIR